MKIAVLGAGAMGMLIGGMLSTANEVTLVDINKQVIDKINADGIIIHEKDGTTKTVKPYATDDTQNMEPVDLVIVFVKSMFSKSALTTNKALIGPNTYLMTLQNGCGHEDTLLEFANEEHVVIGTTQHNSSIKDIGQVNHGGAGFTYMGSISGNAEKLQKIADAFNSAGLQAGVDSNIKKLIWGKMFTNVSASALTAVLKCPLGFIAESEYAWGICETLVNEAIDVANSEGIEFDRAKEIAAVKTVCENAPNGYTSIYADIMAKRTTEVDTISGSVVKIGERNGVQVKTHKTIVEIIHAMQDLNKK